MPGVNNWLKKASKAFIVFTQRPIPKTHDLRFLSEHCGAIDSDLLFLREESKELDSYGYDSRYPNNHFFVDKQKAEAAIEMAEKILSIIRKKIN